MMDTEQPDMEALHKRVLEQPIIAMMIRAIEVADPKAAATFKDASSLPHETDAKLVPFLDALDHEWNHRPQVDELVKALEGIRTFGFRHTGHGYSCATLAEQALTKHKEPA